MLIDYGKYINEFNLDESVTLLGLVFPVYGTRTRGKIEAWFKALKVQYYPFPDKVEILRDELEADRNFFYKHHRSNLTMLQDIWKSLRANKSNIVDRLNLMMTLYRSWEWPYYTDEEMEQFNNSLADKIKNNEISLWKYHKCAYKGPLQENFLKDIEYQWDNIMGYFEDFGIKPLDKTKVFESIEKLNMMIEGTLPFPEEFRSYIEQCREIQYRMKRVIEKIEESLEDGMIPESLMTKQSGSIWNSIPILADEFRNAGYGKITNVVGNFLYASNTCLLPDGFTQNLFDISPSFPDYDMNYLTLVCGKGDGYKIRYVGQCATIYQNFLNPIFTMVRDVMKQNQNVCTFDQGDYFKQCVKASNDMFGIDFSGYSDFLSRNVLFYIMEVIWKIPKHIMVYVKKIFSLPIKVQGEFFEYLYGTLQGIMLDFSAITDANQFMWAVACIYSNFFDKAGFNGDDRFQGTDKKYPKDFMNNQLAFSIICNCVTNFSKTESWRDHGIVTFCHITYDEYKRPVSGLSANSLLKQKKFITDINALYNVFRKNGFWEFHDQKYWRNQIDQILSLNFIQENVRQQYNSLHKNKINVDGIRNRFLMAKSVPIEYGGLNTSKITDDLTLYLNILKIQLLKLSSIEEVKPINYGFLMEKDPTGIAYIDTAYGEFLMKPKSALHEIVETLALVNALINDNFNMNCINLDQLKEVRRRFSSIVRSIEYDGNEKKSVSTKNRVSVRMDSDKAFDSFTEAKEMAISDFEGFNLRASNINELAFLDTLAGYSNRSEGFRYYLRYQQLKNRFGKYIVDYEARKGVYLKGFKSPSTGKILRLETAIDTTNDSSLYKFISFTDIKDQEEKEFIICYQTLWGLSEDSRAKFGKVKERVRARVTQYLLEQYTSVKEYVDGINLNPKEFFALSQAVRLSDQKSVMEFFNPIQKTISQ